MSLYILEAGSRLRRPLCHQDGHVPLWPLQKRLRRMMESEGGPPRVWSHSGKGHELWSHSQKQTQGLTKRHSQPPRTVKPDSTCLSELPFRIAINMPAQALTPPSFKSKCALWLSCPCALILHRVCRAGEEDNLPS